MLALSARKAAQKPLGNIEVHFGISREEPSLCFSVPEPALARLRRKIARLKTCRQLNGSLHMQASTLACSSPQTSPFLRRCCYLSGWLSRPVFLASITLPCMVYCFRERCLRGPRPVYGSLRSCSFSFRQRRRNNRCGRFKKSYFQSMSESAMSPQRSFGGCRKNLRRRWYLRWLWARAPCENAARTRQTFSRRSETALAFFVASCFPKLWPLLPALAACMVHRWFGWAGFKGEKFVLQSPA